MSPPKPKILFIVSSHSRLGDTGRTTGWYLPEFAHPYHVLAPHFDTVVASPTGGEAPLDDGSVEMFKEDVICQNFVKDKEHLWKNTDKLETYLGKSADFELVFVVGGHGPMWDLTHNSALQKLLAEFYEAGKVVAAVCHGSCALLHVKLSNGEHLIKDQPVTGFSDAEEQHIGLEKVVPFALETELINNGGKYEKASEIFGAQVSIGRGGRLITGQNPASGSGVAEAFFKKYQSSKK